MTQQAETRIAGDSATFRVQYVDQATGKPLSLSALGLTPFGSFVQDGAAVWYELRVGAGATIFDDASGLVDFALTPEQSGATVPVLDPLGTPAPCRLIARWIDSAGRRETAVVAAVTMLNAASADVASIPLPSTIVAAVGPSGPAGPAGANTSSLLDAIIFG